MLLILIWVRVLIFDTNGKLLARWAESGPHDREIDQPTDIAVDGQGNIYVVDRLTGLSKFSPAGQLLASWR